MNTQPPAEQPPAEQPTPPASQPLPSPPPSQPLPYPPGPLPQSQAPYQPMPPHMPPKRSRRALWIVLGVVAVVLVVCLTVRAFLPQCFGSDCSPISGSIGQPVKVDSFIITIHKVYTSSGDENHIPEGIYLIIDVSVQNTDTQPSFDGVPIGLGDSGTGKPYPPLEHIYLYGYPPDFFDIPAGKTVRGPMIYDVPQAEHNFVFYYDSRGEFGEGSYITWAFTA